MKNSLNFLLKSSFFVAFIFLSFVGKSQNRDDINNRDILYITSGGKLNPLQANMDIRHYTIELDVNIAKQSIAGFTEVSLNLSQKTDTLMLDLIHLYKVTGIIVNGKIASYFQKDDKIFITSSVGFEKGNQKVKIEYNGIPPVAIKPPWGWRFYLDKRCGGNDWVAINIQGEGGKMYFPSKDHPSDEPNEGVDMKNNRSFKLNGSWARPFKRGKNKKNKSTYHWKTNYTISNYCILFNIGKYQSSKGFLFYY